jgi:hypothetical protein
LFEARSCIGRELIEIRDEGLRDVEHWSGPAD